MDGSGGLPEFGDEALDWIVDLSSKDERYWAKAPSFFFSMAVLYERDRYLGCVLRRRGSRIWKAIPYTPDAPAGVAFSGRLLEVVAWMEDHADSRRA